MNKLPIFLLYSYSYSAPVVSYPQRPRVSLATGFTWLVLDDVSNDHSIGLQGRDPSQAEVVRARLRHLHHGHLTGGALGCGEVDGVAEWAAAPAIQHSDGGRDARVRPEVVHVTSLQRHLAAVSMVAALRWAVVIIIEVDVMLLPLLRLISLPVEQLKQPERIFRIVTLQLILCIHFKKAPIIFWYRNCTIDKCQCIYFSFPCSPCIPQSVL